VTAKIGSDMEPESFSPESLEASAMTIDDLRARLILTDPAGSSAEAEQYFRLAVAALEQAARFLELASMKQVQAIMGRSSRRA
jgi:hypothetical protein